MSTRLWPFLVVFLIAAAPARAVEQAGEADPCEETGMAMQVNCLEQTAEELDRQLNEIYRDLRREISRVFAGNEEVPAATILESLRGAQRAWIAFRNQECHIWHEGHIQTYGATPTLRALDCDVGFTRQRIAELESYLEQVEAM